MDNPNKPWYLNNVKGCVIELNGIVYKILKRDSYGLLAIKMTEQGSWENTRDKFYLYGFAQAKFLRREN
jgi:hypothetical protein